MEPRVCTRSYTRLARARMRAANEWDAMGFIHSSIVDARGDGPTDAPTVKIEIDRIERVSRVSLSLASSSIDSSDEFIHSFIRARTSVANERTKGRRDEETRASVLERDARDATIDASVRVARREVRTSRTHRTHRTHRIVHASFILNDRPETITRNAWMDARATRMRSRRGKRGTLGGGRARDAFDRSRTRG